MIQCYCESHRTEIIVRSERSGGSIPPGKDKVVLINQSQFCKEVQHE